MRWRNKVWKGRMVVKKEGMKMMCAWSPDMKIQYKASSAQCNTLHSTTPHHTTPESDVLHSAVATILVSIGTVWALSCLTMCLESVEGTLLRTYSAGETPAVGRGISVGVWERRDEMR
jgi:hypothetical protein